MNKHQIWASLSLGYSPFLQIEATSHVISVSEYQVFSRWVSVDSW
jgi:hypothetical protein